MSAIPCPYCGKIPFLLEYQEDGFYIRSILCRVCSGEHRICAGCRLEWMEYGSTPRTRACPESVKIFFRLGAIGESSP